MDESDLTQTHTPPSETDSHKNSVLAGNLFVAQHKCFEGEKSTKTGAYPFIPKESVQL